MITLTIFKDSLTSFVDKRQTLWTFDSCHWGHICFTNTCYVACICRTTNRIGITLSVQNTQSKPQFYWPSYYFAPVYKSENSN